jgi:hypothetical protein
MPRWERFGGPVTTEAKPDPQAEKKILRSRIDALAAEMDLVKKRLGELDGE